MRYIYLDEAGTSKRESITVVTGIIINPDTDLLKIQMAIAETFESVPLKIRENFVFHAYDVFSGTDTQQCWSTADRLYFLKNMISIPRRLGLGISLGVVRDDQFEEINGIAHKQACHLMAFCFCLAKADKYIRDLCGLEEIGHTIAEDIPEMRSLLSEAALRIKNQDFLIAPGKVNLTLEDISKGYCSQVSTLGITRIHNPVQFIQKGRDPLLYLADVCAFGFRRYFESLSMGDELIKNMLGKALPLDDWQGGLSYSYFSNNGINKHEMKFEKSPT